MPSALTTSKKEPELKRTRRIEVIRFERRVTWSNQNNALNRSKGHDIDVFLEALGDITPSPEELHYETDQEGQEPPRTKAGNSPTNENQKRRSKL